MKRADLLPPMVAALLVLMLAGCSGDRYSRLACDFGTGQAYILDRWTGNNPDRVTDAPEMDAECRARMGIKAQPEAAPPQ